MLKTSNWQVMTNSNVNFYSSVNTNENILPKMLGKSCDDKGEEFEFKENIRMKLNISRENKIIYSQDFYNQIIISNLKLTKTEDYSNKRLNMNNMNYYNIDIYKLEILFDKSEIPNWIKNKYQKKNQVDNSYENINWTLRVHSTQNIYFILDKIKEDKENLVKESWECEEPGRKDKAKLARMKFNLINKKKNGGILSIEEEEILLKPKRKIRIQVDADSNKSVKSGVKEKSNKDIVSVNRNDYLRSNFFC